MATLTVMAAAPDFAWWPDQIDNNGPNDILSASATELKYTSSTGFVVTLSGSGFALAGGIATAGTVFDVMVRDAADVTDLMTITGLAFSFQSLYYTLFGGGGTGPDPFAALSALLAGDDTLIGSNESDQLGGYSPGNDTVSGNGSNDLIIGDPGNDILAGGSDFDTLSYVELFFGSNAFRGINLDVAAGTVIDCWGGKDTIKGFEEFEGSKFNDVMKGSNNQQYDENFRGLQGDDFIDGRRGWDVAVYWNDARFGGGKGIKANLATGKIIDGWGGTDTVRNIESIFGTMQNDSFVGNKYNNDFHGLAGKDSFNGGAGSDGLGFWLNDYFSGLHGVSVNLSRPSGQVIDDGFGNRETAIAMENVFGTNLADTITGSNLDNFLVGNGGNDRLSGLGNNDVIDASEGDDLVDGGPGNDRLLGGAGVDTLSYASARLGVTMSLARTGPQATGGAGTDTASGFEKLIGGAGADALTGNSLANVLNGNRGNDMLSGVGGNDTLNGGAGADVMKGGAGNDIYLVDNADDVVDESAAGSNGVDLVIASVSFSLVAGKHSKGAVENLTLAGAGAINGTGNALDNVITGNAVANVLRGGDGNDVIKGLGGADTIDGGHGIDTADYSERTGDVTVTLADAAFAAVFVNGVAEDHIRQIENVTGGSGNDQLTGDDNANVLIGGAGADTLTGGKGADVFVIGALADLAAGETIDGTTEPATLDTLRLDAAGAYDLTALTTIANIDVIAFSRNQAGFDLTVGDSLVSTADANGDNTENDLRISASRPMTQGVRIDASELTGSNHIMVDGTDFGGANTIKGGAGDDSVLLRDLTNSSVDGGAGNDKLIYAGSGLTLDLAQSAVVGFEQIDLTGTGNNALVVDQSSVINGTDVAAGGNHVLTVTGNGGDVVSFAEAKWAEVGTLSQGGLTLERYVFGDAEVRVEQGIAVSGPGIFNLAALSATQGFVIQDDGANDRAGSSVSSLGDINSDGFDDLIIGSPNASEAYVIFGTNSGFGVDISGRQVIDLATLSAGTGFIVQGASTSTVSAAGDVNGDGFDDLITGAPSGACILFGTASGFGTDIAGRQIVDLSTLSANNGFFVQSSAIGGVQTVSSVGDINGDGFTDMIFGLPAANDSGFESGEACIVFGSALPFGTNIGGKQVIDLTTLSAAQGFVVEGAKGWDHAGSSVSAAGDVNGDGVGDLIVAAPGFSGGETYVIFGSPSEFGSEVAGRQVINVSTLSAATGFVMQGDNPGASVSAAGDINGDGYDDLIVGALNAPPDYLGAAYVLFGTASGFGTAVGGRQIVDLTALTASEGFVIQGLGSSDFVGGSVSAAGDINGDGFDDLIIGAAGRSEAFVLFGSASGFGVDIGGHRVVSLATLSAHQGFVIKGDQSGDMAGWSVSSAGDVSHDGFDDLLVGAPNGSGGGYLAGQAFVLYGAPFGGSVAPVTIIGLSAAESLIGGAGNDTLAGGGGADAIRGGAGNDAISVPDLAFRSIDGGSGTDTLVFTGTGQTIDLTALADTTVKGIEAFDISGTGNYTIIIGALDTFHFSDIPNDDFTAAGSRNSFVVHGDAGDTLDLDGYDPDGAGPIEAYAWELTASGKNLDGSNGGGFDFYDLVRGSAIVASIAVDAGVSVVIA